MFLWFHNSNARTFCQAYFALFCVINVVLLIIYNFYMGILYIIIQEERFVYKWSHFRNTFSFYQNQQKIILSFPLILSVSPWFSRNAAFIFIFFRRFTAVQKSFYLKIQHRFINIFYIFKFFSSIWAVFTWIYKIMMIYNIIYNLYSCFLWKSLSCNVSHIGL